MLFQSQYFLSSFKMKPILLIAVLMCAIKLGECTGDTPGDTTGCGVNEVKKYGQKCAECTCLYPNGRQCYDEPGWYCLCIDTCARDHYGKCVPKESCPNSSVTSTTMTPAYPGSSESHSSESSESSGSKDGESNDGSDSSDSDDKEPPCPIPRCAPGYYLNNKAKPCPRCVRIPPGKCGDNEEWRIKKKCEEPKCNSNKPCGTHEKPKWGCYCKDRFWRRSDGCCVPQENCTTCPTVPPCMPGCELKSTDGKCAQCVCPTTTTTTTTPTPTPCPTPPECHSPCYLESSYGTCPYCYCPPPPTTTTTPTPCPTPPECHSPCYLESSYGTCPYCYCPPPPPTTTTTTTAEPCPDITCNATCPKYETTKPCPKCVCPGTPPNCPEYNNDHCHMTPSTDDECGKCICDDTECDLSGCGKDCHWEGIGGTCPQCYCPTPSPPTTTTTVCGEHEMFKEIDPCNNCLGTCHPQDYPQWGCDCEPGYCRTSGNPTDPCVPIDTCHNYY